MASSSSALQTYINHGVSLLPSNHAEEEEEESQSSKSTPGVNTWWSAEDIKKYLNKESPGAVVEAMERLHFRQHHWLRQYAPR